MRHAKSSWKDENLVDYERPLSKRGLHDAPRMGRLLRDEELIPDVIYCSPALRARMTVSGVVDQSGFGNELVFLEELYGANLDIFLATLRGLPEQYTNAMFIGHNPDLEAFLEHLTGKWHKMPTAALAYLVLPVQLWQDINDQTEAKLVYLWKPRELP